MLGLVAGLSHTARARACGPSPEPVYAVDKAEPSGVNTPINAPLLVHLREEPTAPALEQFVPNLTLTKQGSDEAVELKSLGYGAEQAWLPLSELDPETTYEAHFNPGYEGAPDTIWTFTTSAEAWPTLALEGQLEVTIEEGTQTVLQCPNDACPCGGSEEARAAACTEG